MARISIMLDQIAKSNQRITDLLNVFHGERPAVALGQIKSMQGHVRRMANRLFEIAIDLSHAGKK